jgi:hypothetical protein
MVWTGEKMGNQSSAVKIEKQDCTVGYCEGTRSSTTRISIEEEENRATQRQLQQPFPLVLITLGIT